MPGAGPICRRTALKVLGRGTFAIAVFGAGAAACSSDTAGTTTGGSLPPTAAATVPTTIAATTAAPTTTQPTAEAPPTTSGLAAVSWQRVFFNSVSAYVLVREGEAAIVDTGFAGSAAGIGAALDMLDLGWDAVGHVILTHLHRDHIGGLGEVMTQATDAMGYAGAADLDAMSSPRPLAAVGDGDTVFGLQIIETPGHTDGHICVLDPVGGVLVAGDALQGAGGEVIGPNPQFSSNMLEAERSVRKLAEFSFETALFGHGNPVEAGASAQVAALAG
jgi:glyoxylase-like metal-dependent hydrolase (beta-lactamase superfamily II)